MISQDNSEKECPPLWFPSLVPSEFIRRDNRFRIKAAVSGQPVDAHLPNSGRLGELLVRGRRVWLNRADLAARPARRTAYDVVLVEYRGRLVSVDARVPGRLLAAALRDSCLDGFHNYTKIQREVRLGSSRLDFRLVGAAPLSPCWLEVKSVTLVEGGVARFPDAPTLRGRRHVQELTQAATAGERAVVGFVVQREDALQFTPHRAADEKLALALEQAKEAGVEVLAWRCHVSLQGIKLIEQIPVVL
jgi:sugar fermentation stimulation protein A